MQQIAHWLEELGMSEYAPRFAENGISVAALPHLTDHDLKDIGKIAAARAELAKNAPPIDFAASFDSLDIHGAGDAALLPARR
jgi:uncharacterized protein YjiS (DUF1127 family)